MDKNMKIKQVYRALLFVKNILNYSPELEALTKDSKELQPAISAVQATIALAEEYKRNHPNVEDSKILELMNEELSADLEKVDCNISCINEIIQQLESNIAKILEQLLPNGIGCIGISPDTFKEEFNKEYTYIFDNIKVFGKQVQPEMFFTLPSMCYKPSALPTSAEPIQATQDIASENPVQPSSGNEYEKDISDLPVKVDEDDFDEDAVLDDKTSQPTVGNDASPTGMSSDFESYLG